MKKVDLAHFLHPESSPCHILPISYSSKVVEIRQNDFQKCSKVFQYVQKFKDLKQRQRFCLRKGEERGIVFILSVGHFPGISLKFCRTVAAWNTVLLLYLKMIIDQCHIEHHFFLGREEGQWKYFFILKTWPWLSSWLWLWWYLFWLWLTWY